MTAVLGNVAADHPAKWSSPVVLDMAEIVAAERERRGHQLAVVDPFAGIGRGRLADALRPNVSEVVGVELQSEWCVDEQTIQGNACHLPDDWAGRFHGWLTSPCYGNRMGDHHQAADQCKACGGTGAGRKGELAADRPCATCKGTGLSWRNTYAHALRRHGGELVPGSAAGMQWGPEYRALHRRALTEGIRVVVEGGLLAINMSNHPRTLVKGGPQVEQLVVEWWLNEVILAGCRIQEVRRVSTRRNRQGANGHAAEGRPDPRVDGEVIIVAHTPDPRRLL